MQIQSTDAGYRLETTTIIPAPLEEVFAFFSRAENLERITPPWVHFHFVAPPPQIAEGARIEYALRVRLLPLRWVTEISVWKPPHRFVDRQLKGPYRDWVHEHRFEAAERGTRMTDVVYYRLPFGPLGRLAHALVVRRDIEQIFRYRARRIREMFAGSGAE